MTVDEEAIQSLNDILTCDIESYRAQSHKKYQCSICKRSHFTISSAVQCCKNTYNKWNKPNKTGFTTI